MQEREDESKASRRRRMRARQAGEEDEGNARDRMHRPTFTWDINL